MRLVKNLRYKRKVVFDSGNFDNWCVFVVEADRSKKAPYDVEYFTELKNWSTRYGSDKVYQDFLKIYHLTTKEVSWTVLKLIDEIAATYDEEDRALAEQWWTVIYAGMIAEENKENAILKKRIKHLGVHQILMLDFAPEQAAGYSTGKKWKMLDDEMRVLGV